MTARTHGHSPALWIAALAALLALGFGRSLRAQDCRPGDQPAATLLFPYFEVDLDGGRTTLIAIHARNGPTLARVTLWTDWGVPTVSFDIYVQRRGVQTINLRDILASGRAPETGPGANAFPGCPSFIGNVELWSPEALQRAHTGRASDGTTCYSSPRSDSTLATGYVTADVSLRCPPQGRNPTSAGYFSGTSPIAKRSNELFGDFFLVDPGQNYAGGQSAVHIVATDGSTWPARSAGQYTFYGSLLGFSAADQRLPLANAWFTRFLTGGGFDGGTHVIVWRDIRAPRVPVPCLQGPAWAPLGEDTIAIRDEQGFGTIARDTQAFPLATQRVPLSALGVEPNFGTLRFVLDYANGQRAQAWVGWDANAQGRFNVSQAGIPMMDPCTLTP